MEMPFCNKIFLKQQKLKLKLILNSVYLRLKNIYIFFFCVGQLWTLPVRFSETSVALKPKRHYSIRVTAVRTTKSQTDSLEYLQRIRLKELPAFSNHHVYEINSSSFIDNIC
jgi:hypothetical protein